MEPIRYLQPATFPPPAFNCNAVKSVLRRNKCTHGNNNDNNNKAHSTHISGSNCSLSVAQTSTTHSQQQQQPQAQSQHQHSYRQNDRCSRILWCLAFVIFIFCCCNQAVQASPIFVDNPNLAQFQTGRNIRHLPCIVRRSGLSGTCMFAIDCIKQNGTHLGTCIDRFYFGSCCQIKDEHQDFAPEISDNSIDQNTILHFVPEATTLPTSALYKTTTESQQHKSNSNNTHLKQPTTATTTTNALATKPTKITTSTTTTTTTQQQTKKPVGNSNSTHKNSQFVVRTTKKPTTTKATTTTNRQKPTTTTTKTTTTQQPITTTSQATRKPTRRKPTKATTTIPPPILTTDGPRVPGSFETTISPPKLFTFQMVETTTPVQTESTNFIEFSTLPPSTMHHKRPQKPTTQEHKTSEVTSIITTIESSTTKVRPSPPIRHTSKPKPATLATTTATPQTTLTTQKHRKPTPPKKTATKLPKPTTQPTTVGTTARPVPLADEVPPTVITHQKPSTTGASHVHTTHPQTTRPKPIATVTKTPGSTIITTTMAQHKKPTPATTFATKKPKPKPTTTTTTTTTEKPATTTTTRATTTTTTTLPPPKITTTKTTISTTFKPGLITWTNEGAEPIMNATLNSDQQQWLPVPTIAPETSPNHKNEVTSSAPITSASTSSTSTTTTSTTTSTTTAPPVIISSTEKIIVSVSSSVSEVHKNETRPPVKPQTGKPQTPSSTKRPTTPVKPILSTTTAAPTVDEESSTLNPDVTGDSSTDSNWGSATTGFMTMTDGVTEDYNATMMMGTPTATTLPPMPANAFEGVDYREICGRRMFPEPKIVGGSNAAFGRWPWQISLRQWRTSTYLHKCGAALLNENWAITAAHCVDNVPPSDLLLRLGEYDLAEEEEPYGYQERRVQIVASHPQFDPRTFEYDLALLRFYEPVVFQPNIIPVCVPNSDENFIGQTAFVTGWGRLYEEGPLPSVLQEVAVPVINNTICETMYRAAGYIEHIPHIFICAGWKKGGYDSCEGDSGGPMVLQREDDKRFQLGGVISWGIGCAEANQPGVYTRISEFRDWINQILQF